MTKRVPVAVYWDSSSILSVLFKDAHSKEALNWFRKDGVHLISTLSYTEVCAVISRIKREKLLADILIDVAFKALKTGPWRYLNIWPEWDKLGAFSQKWSLKGTHLWHLATAKTLQKQIPELTLLTFDSRLGIAVKGEGLVAK
ncbi:MAG: type II toxin-antitoxin system VapC family toxin [Candidatus Aminicenantes bacterium]|nr:type II toxin-antitoxin system VapC family toxin [Candidatus Aminicenantes bacterium]